MLTLENASGGGWSIGTTIEELAAIAEAAAALGVSARRLAFCLDVAHAWGAGVAMDDPDSIDAVPGRNSTGDRARAPGDGPPQRLPLRDGLAPGPARARRRGSDRCPGPRPRGHPPAPCRRSRSSSRRRGWRTATTWSTSNGCAALVAGAELEPLPPEAFELVRRARTGAPDEEPAADEPSARPRPTSRSATSPARPRPDEPSPMPAALDRIGLLVVLAIAACCASRASTRAAVRRRPGPRHADARRVHARRRGPAARAEDVGRRVPPRRLLLLPARAGGGDLERRSRRRDGLASRCSGSPPSRSRGGSPGRSAARSPGVLARACCSRCRPRRSTNRRSSGTRTRSRSSPCSRSARRGAPTRRGRAALVGAGARRGGRGDAAARARRGVPDRDARHALCSSCARDRRHLARHRSAGWRVVGAAVRAAR